ncbi:MAG: GNAT family N-acetyltransferase [Bacteroidota bacterium]|nr:GNAT family N-acetyltransferase [Bacteroidota bacterium]
MNLSEIEVVHNHENKQFEIRRNDLIARIPYSIKDDSIGLLQTHVPDEWRGKGLAKKLAECALNYAKENNLRIIPYCSFVAKYIEEHPEWLPYLHVKRNGEVKQKK